jgi:hypothetical protein
MFHFLEQYLSLILYSLLAVAYFIYYRFSGYAVVKMAGDYDHKRKTLGRHLPPYPNGWYVAAKSFEIAPGAVKAIDISGQNITIFRSPKG